LRYDRFCLSFPPWHSILLLSPGRLPRSCFYSIIESNFIFLQDNLLQQGWSGFLSREKLAMILRMEKRDEVLRRIRERIQELGLRQAQLASYLGLTQGNLSQRLAGKIRFTLDELAKLLPLLDLSFLPLPQQTVPLTNPGITLLVQTLSQLSDTDRREFFLVAALVLEGKLSEPQRSQVCGALRLLASGGTET
jgi:transcriptional regulator with XRE-family HTH domain